MLNICYLKLLFIASFKRLKKLLYSGLQIFACLTISFKYFLRFSFSSFISFALISCNFWLKLIFFISVTSVIC